MPRDQRRKVEQTQKATQQLLELRRQSSSSSMSPTSAVTSPTTPTAKPLSRPTMAPPPPPPPQRSAETVITTRAERPVSAAKTRDRSQGLNDRGERSNTLTSHARQSLSFANSPGKENLERRNSVS